MGAKSKAPAFGFGDAAKLRPGDVLLYRGLWAIRIKTWSDVGHCEVYIGDGHTITAKSGGVKVYPFEVPDLAYVYRPIGAFDLAAARAWFDAEANGQGYDYLGLFLSFYAVKQGRDNRKMFCSEVSTRFLEAGGVCPFGESDADAIAPAEFRRTPALACVWSAGKGWIQ